jgi:hypothetical protein
VHHSRFQDPDENTGLELPTSNLLITRHSIRVAWSLEDFYRLNRVPLASVEVQICNELPIHLAPLLSSGEAMHYEYKQIYIPVAKKGWSELGSALEELSSEGWDLFMADPIISLTAIMPGISGSRTSAIVHHFRRPVTEHA